MSEKEDGRKRNGGPRPGSGRKRSEAAELRTAYLNTLHMDAVAASEAQRKLLNHLSGMVGKKSDLEPAVMVDYLTLLSTVAEKIQNRAWGKPMPVTPEGDTPKGLILDL